MLRLEPDCDRSRFRPRDNEGQDLGPAASVRRSGMLTGGLFCDGVRYALRGAPLHSTRCHGCMCRRIVKAASVARFSVRSRQFQLLAGEPRGFRSSAAQWTFRERHGTRLTFAAGGKDEIEITTASLDSPDAGLSNHPTSRSPSL